MWAFKLKNNKAFKWDLARVAFSVCVEFVVAALCGSFCIACLHPLTRRYEPAPYVTWAEKFQISYEIACYEE